jgi:ribosomal protein S18 acetylase RimI-like enzyme
VSATTEPASEIRDLHWETDAGLCFPLMQQLRPHLSGDVEFATRWRRQEETAGYRLIGLWQDGRLQALAGFRVIENLVHGPHLYVDDLVTSEEVRGLGHGAKLLRHLRKESRALGYEKLLLDTPLSNVLAHRFYYRQGLLGTALRFSIFVGGGD